MAGRLDAGNSRFPEVTWVDVETRGNAVHLIFGTRIEGHWAALRLELAFPQWENLKFLVEGPKSN
jgi:hypothetical protein